MSPRASLKLGLVMRDAELREQIRAALQPSGARVLFERTSDVSSEEVRATLERLQPDVLVLEAGSCQLAESAIGLANPPSTIAVHRVPDPELILAAMRAGLKEFIYPPVAARMTEALDRIRQNRAESDASLAGRMLYFLSAKGGCGATTVACHVAAELASAAAEKVLLADLDESGGAVGFVMHSRSGYTLDDAVENTSRLDPSYWAALVAGNGPNLDVIQSAYTLGRTSAARDDLRLGEVLRFMRVHYPWTVLDLGRGRQPAVWDSLEPQDRVFVVSTVDLIALHQARALVKALQACGVESDRLQLILNAVPKDPLVTPQEIEATLGIGLYAVLSAEGAALLEAKSSRRLVSPHSSFGKQIGRAVSRLVGRSEAAPKRRFSFFSSGK
jgi:pilus assembly protein CpaE